MFCFANPERSLAPWPPTPMPAMFRRLLAASAPLSPRTEPGTMDTPAATPVVMRKKVLRDKWFLLCSEDRVEVMDFIE